MKKLIQSISQKVNKTSPTSLKECYRFLLFFTLLNFILLIFWAINPFQWVGWTSFIFDGLIIVYGIIMSIMMTSTLFQRFIDASINPYQAIIFPVVMTTIFALIRLRSFSEIMIIIILTLYFLSHFYLMMLVMMPSIKHDDQTS